MGRHMLLHYDLMLEVWQIGLELAEGDYGTRTITSQYLPLGNQNLHKSISMYHSLQDTYQNTEQFHFKGKEGGEEGGEEGVWKILPPPPTHTHTQLCLQRQDHLCKDEIYVLTLAATSMLSSMPNRAWSMSSTTAEEESDHFVNDQIQIMRLHNKRTIWSTHFAR